MTTTQKIKSIPDKLVEIKAINEELSIVEDSISRIDYVIMTYKSYDGIKFVTSEIGEKKNDFALPLEIQLSIANQLKSYYEKRRKELIAQAAELIK